MLRRNWRRWLASGIIAVLLLSVWITPPAADRAYAFTEANATQAMDDFLDVFWDPAKKYFYTNSDRQIHAHAHGPENGLYTDYWWEAQLWEVVMDAYERTGNTDYLPLIDDIFEGFLDAYPDWSDNPYNDDIGWWALAALRAYDITGNTDYRDEAKDMFDHIWSFWSKDFGGGIWWNTVGHLPQKNVATNAVAATIAIQLSRAYNDPGYLTKAYDLYEWVEDTLYEGNGYVNDQYRQGVGVLDWEYTYNFGNFARASYEMYVETSDSDYLDNAIDSIDWVFDNMTVDGKTLLYEGVDDTPAFKMILARNMAYLVEHGGVSQYEELLQFNATQAWNHRRLSDGIIGPDWSRTPDSGYIQSIAAGAGVSILFLSDPDDVTGTVVGLGPYEAENARHIGVSNEQNAYENAGYSGRGYVAGWNASGTAVEFPVNVQTAGIYALTFRYSAGAGNAVRELKVNGNTVSLALTFGGTGSWSAWQEVTVHTALTPGTNVVRLGFESGSANYLNLDRLTITSHQLYEAEDAVLHNLTIESTHSGYTGSGYVAGWNADGQWVDFVVTAEAAGSYDLQFRYAAAAGDAGRYLYVNGSGVVGNVTFVHTGSWSSYAVVTVSGVNLNSGSNTISIIFDSSKGSSNWLNLDSLAISP